MLRALVGAALVAGGSMVAAGQAALRLQDRARPLTAAETALLDRVFRGSVALGKVRIVPRRSGVFGVNRRPFTLGRTMYLKGRDPAAEPALLVHECTHVWQYQHHGARYAVDALMAQWKLPDAYDWRPERARGKARWVDFNAEAQASYIEHLFSEGLLDSPDEALAVVRRPG